MPYDEFLTSLIQQAMVELKSLVSRRLTYRKTLWGLVTPLVCLGLSNTGLAQYEMGTPAPGHGPAPGASSSGAGRNAAGHPGNSPSARSSAPGYSYQAWPYRQPAPPATNPGSASTPQRGLYQIQQQPLEGSSGYPAPGLQYSGGNPYSAGNSRQQGGYQVGDYRQNPHAPGRPSPSPYDQRQSAGRRDTPGSAGLLGPGQSSHRDLPSQPAAAGATLSPKSLQELDPRVNSRPGGGLTPFGRPPAEPHEPANPELAIPQAALLIQPMVGQLGSHGTLVIQVRNTGVAATTGLTLEVESTAALPLGDHGAPQNSLVARQQSVSQTSRSLFMPINQLAFGESREITIPMTAQTLGEHVVRCRVMAGQQSLDEVSSTVRVIPRHLEFELVAAGHRQTNSPLGSTIRVKNVTSQPISKVAVKLAFDEALEATRLGAATAVEPGLVEWQIELLQPGEVAWLPMEFTGRRSSQESCLRATLSRNEIPLDQIDHPVTLSDDRLPVTLDILDRNEPSSVESRRSVIFVVRNHGFDPCQPAVGIRLPAGWRLASVTDPKESRNWQVKSRAGELLLCPSTTVDAGEAAVIGLELIPQSAGNSTLTGRLYFNARNVLSQPAGSVLPDLEVEEQLAIHSSGR